MSIWVAVGLITLCALCWDFGIVLQKIATAKLPRIALGRELPRVLGAMLRSREWMGGLAVSAAGWGLFAFALEYTPVSVARAVQGSGFVVLAFFSIVFLRHRLTLAEWAGVALVTCGIIALGIVEASTPQPSDVLDYGRLGMAALACLAACAVTLLARRALRERLPWVVAFSIVAGLLLGLGDVLTKVLLVMLGRGTAAGAIAAAAVALIAFYLTGFVVLSRGYQHGRAIVVTALSDFCSRLVAIFAGTLAMGEVLATPAPLRSAQVAGYAAILLGAALLARFSGEGMSTELTARPAATD